MKRVRIAAFAFFAGWSLCDRGGDRGGDLSGDRDIDRDRGDPSRAGESGARPCEGLRNSAKKQRCRLSLPQEGSAQLLWDATRSSHSRPDPRTPRAHPEPGPFTRHTTLQYCTLLYNTRHTRHVIARFTRPLSSPFKIVKIQRPCLENVSQLQRSPSRPPTRRAQDPGPRFWS